MNYLLCIKAQKSIMLLLLYEDGIGFLPFAPGTPTGIVPNRI